MILTQGSPLASKLFSKDLREGRDERRMGVLWEDAMVLKEILLSLMVYIDQRG